MLRSVLKLLIICFKLCCQASGVLFISGDVHFCEVTRYDCAVSYPLYEFTSSGISHAVETTVAEPFSFLLRLAAWLTPSTLRIYRSNCRYRSCVYGNENASLYAECKRLHFNNGLASPRLQAHGCTAYPLLGPVVPWPPRHPTGNAVPPMQKFIILSIPIGESVRK